MGLSSYSKLCHPSMCGACICTGEHAWWVGGAGHASSISISSHTGTGANGPTAQGKQTLCLPSIDAYSLFRCIAAQRLSPWAAPAVLPL